ncbi:unnamed protein product [Hermetia illucens]|uniref:U3 small nucleolar RNA-associated protein 15 homolog n=1 Tax=Hermetia illucens TaxID=343691 RepID=A0A7R8UQC6_HERIL|nr:U3 small nucleolar RNA-associated protein 15 homolog [Hermetia illucens]CAD7084700.1 unnamed protein product [Hermetia illucens]
MSWFKAINTNKYIKTGPAITPDLVYWKKLSVPTLVKEFGAIDYIDFSPVEPHYFAVTCSVRVQIYNPITKLVAKNLSRFQSNAYGGCFRKDGRLLVAGDEEGFVKLFDVSSRNVLRFFRGHKAAVHRTFFTEDLLKVASFSDDKTVRLWDIATEKTINSFEGHSDYIRAGSVNPTSPNIILSGGYDNAIKMYDTRTDSAVFSVDHGSPVESLLFLPTGGIFLSAGGTEVKVWDVLAGGKLLARLSQHHKTVTTLKLASNGRRILSGGLDRHVKVYDVATYQQVHNMDFPNSILSLGVAPEDQTLVVGMVDGLVSIQNMEQSDKEVKVEKKRALISSMHVDQVVPESTHGTEAKYNHHLRKFEYSKALDCVMRAYVTHKSPHITVSVLQELIHRKGLHRALAGRNHTSLGTIIRFILKHIGEHRFMRVLTDAAAVLLEVYEDEFDQFTGDIGKLFINLAKALRSEVDLTYDLLELQGALELIIGAASISENRDESIQFTKDTTNIRQSEKAKASSVVSLM